MHCLLLILASLIILLLINNTIILYLDSFFFTLYFYAQPLIIEYYDVPYTKIANILFKNKVFKHISEPCIEPEEQDVYAYTRKDEDDYRAISYYFKKILYFENGRIVCTDKMAHKTVLYDPDTSKPIVFSRNQPSEQIDKTAFLPQINAQNGDIVIFPDQEDEDED